jgi:hypothetical protein
MTQKEIPRNDDEQDAFKALLDAVGENVPFHEPDSTKTRVTAEAIERHLLAAGYQIIKIEEVQMLNEIADEAAAASRRSSSLGFYD